MNQEDLNNNRSLIFFFQRLEKCFVLFIIRFLFSVPILQNKLHTIFVSSLMILLNF